MESPPETHLAPPASTLPARVPMSEFFERLRSVVGEPGPFLNCYLPLLTPDDIQRSRAAIDSADLTDGETAGLLHLLADASERAATGESTDAMVVVIRAESGAAFVQHYPEPVVAPIIERADVPMCGAAIEAEQRLRHHVLAVMSDDGLDILTFPRHGDASLHHAAETDLDRVAGLIAETVRTTSTRLVLLAGSDERIAEVSRRVRLEVPIETAVEAVTTPGEGDDLADLAVQHVANDRAVRTVETLHTWRFERAHGLANTDLVDSVQALRSGDCRVLLISDDPDDQRQVWVGPQPEDLAIDLEDATDSLDTTDLRPVRMTDGLIRSALLQGVSIQMVPMLPDSTLPGGVGVLRETAPDRDLG